MEYLETSFFSLAKVFIVKIPEKASSEISPESASIYLFWLLILHVYFSDSLVHKNCKGKIGVKAKVNLQKILNIMQDVPIIYKIFKNLFDKFPEIAP